MKKAIIIALGICYTLSAAAQGETNFIEPSKNKVKETRVIEQFTKLDVSGCFDVQLIKDDAKTITLSGADNILPLIVTQTHGDTLSIHLKDGLQIKPCLQNRVTIKVPFTLISDIKLYGAGSITSKNTIRTAINLKLEGSGSIKLNLYSPKSAVDMVGSGVVQLHGYTDSISCKLTGSGSIKAGELETDLADVILMGSGSIKVSSTKKIKGRINGSGSVAFGGTPEGQDLMRTGTGEFSAF